MCIDELNKGLLLSTDRWMDGEWIDGWMYRRTTRNINAFLKEVLNQHTLLHQNDAAYKDKTHLSFNISGTQPHRELRKYKLYQ